MHPPHQVLPPPVHQLLTGQPEEHGGPAGQLRRHPDELPGVGRNQAAAHQGHAEEAVQRDHDGAGEAVFSWTRLHSRRSQLVGTNCLKLVSRNCC